MHYVYQFLIIGGITFLGELCHIFIPLPIPSSVYGMVLMFISLLSGLIKEENIQEMADFLLLIMPVMFIGPSVGVMENYIDISNHFLIFMFVVLISTVLIMSVTAVVAEFLLKRGNKHE